MEAADDSTTTSDDRSLLDIALPSMVRLPQSSVPRTERRRFSNFKTLMDSYENWKCSEKEINRTTLCYSTTRNNRMLSLSKPFIPPPRPPLFAAPPRGPKASKYVSGGFKSNRQRNLTVILSRLDDKPETDIKSVSKSTAHENIDHNGMRIVDHIPSKDSGSPIPLKNHRKMLWMNILYVARAMKYLLSSTRIIWTRRQRARKCISKYITIYVSQKRIAHLWSIMMRNLGFLLALRIRRKRSAVLKIKIFIAEQLSTSMRDSHKLIKELIHRIILCQRSFRSWIAVNKARLALLNLYWRKEQKKRLRALRKKDREEAEAAAQEDIESYHIDWRGSPERKLQRRWHSIKKNADILCGRIQRIWKQTAAIQLSAPGKASSTTNKRQAQGRYTDQSSAARNEANSTTRRNHVSSVACRSSSSIGVTTTVRPSSFSGEGASNFSVGMSGGGSSKPQPAPPGGLSGKSTPPGTVYRVGFIRRRGSLLPENVVNEKYNIEDSNGAGEDGTTSPLQAKMKKAGILKSRERSSQMATEVSMPLIGPAERDDIIREHLRATRQLYLAAISDAYEKAVIDRDKGLKSIEDARRLLHLRSNYGGRRVSLTNTDVSWHGRVKLSLYAMSKTIPFLLFHTAETIGKSWATLVEETVTSAVQKRKQLEKEMEDDELTEETGKKRRRVKLGQRLGRTVTTTNGHVYSLANGRRIVARKNYLKCVNYT